MTAKVEALLIGEVEPDTFSTLIQKKLSWDAKKPIDYSHACMRFNGVIWHCAEKGVIDEPEEIVLEGSVIRYRKEFELICSTQVFQAELEGERGKGYATWQNYGLVFPFLKWCLWNKDALRNCSEFVGAKITKYLPYDSEHQLKGDLDWCSPYDLERLWKMERVG